MQITITKIDFEKAPKGYMVANVSYIYDGKNESRKIMSFAAPVVYRQLQDLAKGELPVNVNVILERSGKFWNWVMIETGMQEHNTSKPVEARPAGRVVGSNFETPEERARRQVYIIRQSSISSAIEYLKAKEPKGTSATVEDVKTIAKEFEKFVFEGLEV